MDIVNDTMNVNELKVYSFIEAIRDSLSMASTSNNIQLHKINDNTILEYLIDELWDFFIANDTHPVLDKILTFDLKLAFTRHKHFSIELSKIILEMIIDDEITNNEQLLYIDADTIDSIISISNVYEALLNDNLVSGNDVLSFVNPEEAQQKIRDLVLDIAMLFRELNYNRLSLHYTIFIGWKDNNTAMFIAYNLVNNINKETL